MPVRHGKSELATHWTPIWHLLNRPSAGRVLIATHNDDFATFFGGRIRDRFDETPAFGLKLKPSSRAAGSWNLAAGGALHTAGIGGSITGRGFDLIICDDVVKDFESAHSPRQRQIAWDWFAGTLNSRLQPGGSIIMIQSRWHQDDLVGRLIGDEYESEEYEVIDLPAIATARDVIGREPGAALWPQEWPLEELARRRKAVGSYVWAAQYQASPTTPEGNIFRTAWWRYIDAGEMPQPDITFRIWDLGYSDAPSADWTVGIRMSVHYDSSRVFIEDVQRFRLSAGQRDSRIKETAAKDGSGIIIVLPDDLGQIDHFSEHVLTGYMIEPVKETKSKPERAISFAARVEGQDVYLVRDTPDNPWNAPYVNELSEFPTGAHDDQVDPSANGYNLITDPRFQPLIFA